MSIAICRVDKCSSAHDIAGIQIHDRRERQHSHSNPDIDFNRSGDNYSLCDRSNGLSFNAVIDKIIDDEYTSKRTIRKDAVRMVQVLFTSDSEFFTDKSTSEQRAFFESCYKWAAEKWGESRIISADVHLDEKTPHLHLNFVPLVEDVDKKTGEVITTLNVHKAVGSGSRALQKLQDEFYMAVGKPYGMDRGSRADIDNGEQPRKNQKSEQYKQTTKYHQTAINALQANVQALQAQEQAYTDILHAAPENAVQGVPVPSVAKIAIGKENKDKLLYSPSDIKQLQELAKACAVTSAANDRRSSELEQEVAEQEHIAADLSEREHLITLKEQQAEYARSSAERKLREAEEKQAFYETSEPMVQQLQQRVNGLIAENNGLIRDLRQERKAKDSLTEHNAALKKQLSDQQAQIQPIQQQNSELLERVRVLEEEVAQKNEEIQKISEKKQIIDSLYNTACECAEYICNKVGMDFDRILDMRIDGYRLSYIVDEGRGISR